ncbi:hypothetical protein DFQ15_10838 [Xylophilus ampelinus]|uniref:Uncharacterized protein n=1 Tax=Xylophilus ampelinus TaxID=54067 RepID=A0A318SHV9_9BURK|nr:hypothetical protein DFQ15_10838 [Xylophilus ampelinus]
MGARVFNQRQGSGCRRGILQRTYCFDNEQRQTKHLSMEIPKSY